MSNNNCTQPANTGQQTCGYWWVWILLLAIILLTSAIRVRLLDVPLERDEGEYAYGGQMLLQGFLPYEPPSLYKYKLPGIYFLYASFLALFGQTPVGVRTGLLAANLTTILLLFLLAKQLFGSFAAVSAASFYAVISLSNSVLGLFAHAEHFVMLAAVGGILLLLKTIDNYRWWALLLSGLLLGCAYWIRQHGAAFAAFGGIYLFWQILKQPERKWQHMISRPAIFFAGIVLPFLLTCVIFLFAGTFDKFWFWTFTHARTYAEFMSFSIGMKLLAENLSGIVISSALVWLFAICGLIVLLKNPQFIQQRFFMIAFFIFSFLSVCPGMYFRRHYFVMLLPAVALLAGFGTTQIKIFATSRLRPLGAGIILAAVVFIAVAYTVYYEHNVFFKSLSSTNVSRFNYGSNPFPESLEIAHYIEKHSSPNDTVAVLGSEPQILFYAKRRSPTGYMDVYEMMSSQPYALEMQKGMIKEIESSAPKFLVFVHSYMSWLPEPNSYSAIFEWFENYQQQNYIQVGIVDVKTAMPTVYFWGQNAAKYIPTADDWVAIFEREVIEKYTVT